MSITALASAVPLPQVPSGTFWITDNQVALSAPSIPHAWPIDQGDAETVPAKWNANAARLDLGEKYGGGAMGVLYGLVPSAGTGLQVSITAGHANINGITELYAVTTAVLAASSTNRVWFKTNGTLEVISTGITPPATAAVFLGSLITDGAGVTSVDLSGVVSLVNGVCERSTADVAKPTDSPPATWRGWTKTLVGDWYWNGAEYQRLTDDLPFVKDVLVSGESVRIPVNHQVQIFNALQVQAGATLSIDGRLRVTT